MPTLSAVAAESSPAVSGNYTYTVSGQGNVTITAYTGEETKVEIPAQIGGAPVTRIGANAFKGKTSITELTIPYGITYIANYAFQDCTGLQLVFYQCQLSDIGNDPFAGCVNLRTMQIGSQVEDIWQNGIGTLMGENLETYVVEQANKTLKAKDGVLYKKNSDDTWRLYRYPLGRAGKTFTTPKEITQIHSKAFAGAKNLESLIIEGTELNINGSPAVSECPRLARITFGEGVSYISWAAVSKCPNLEEVTVEVADFPYDIDGVFSECANLSTYVVGKNVKEFEDLVDGNVKQYIVEKGNDKYTAEDGVLYQGTTLLRYPRGKSGAKLTIGGKVTEIADQAFAHARYLQDVRIERPVKTIGSYAFNGCELLNRVEIGKNVTKIKEGAFQDVAVWGHKDTEAQRYAKEAELTFVDIDAYEEQKKGTESAADAGFSEWTAGVTEKITPAGNTYIVQTAGQLAWVAAQTQEGNSFQGKKILLAADIDLDGQMWTPIGSWAHPFRGDFDGQNHLISNLTVSGETTDGWAGLFGYVSNNVGGWKMAIQNIRIENAKVLNPSSGGSALIGRLYAGQGAEVAVQNCTVNGVMEGSTIGGAIGMLVCDAAAQVTVQNIDSSCTMKTGGRGGGICGKGEFHSEFTYKENKESAGNITIKECTFEGTLKGTGRYGAFGGIISEVDASDRGVLLVERCRTEGVINSSNYVSSGGIMASAGNPQNTIRSCVNYAAVEGGYYVGGIVGSNGARIEECYNGGSVLGTATGCPWGGITGQNNGGGTIINCYNAGTIKGGSFNYTGGITGHNYGTLENCYTIANLPYYGSGSTYVSRPGAMGGIVGGTTSYCYYDKNVDKDSYLYGTLNHTQEIINDSAQHITHSGGMTTAQMKTPSSYQNWDFEKVWVIDSEYSGGYPTLRSVKDLLKKAPDESLEIAEGFCFKVVDQDGAPVPEANVECAGKTQTTNEKGEVRFEYVENDGSNDTKMTLRVQKSGYYDYEDTKFTMNPTLEYTVRLVSKTDAGDHVLRSATLEFHDHHYELLTQTKEINKYFGKEKMVITCQPLQDRTEIDSYAIYQGNKEVARSDDGVFHVTPDDFIETTKARITNKTKIVIYDRSGVEKEEVINLNFVDERDQVSGVEFGNDLKITYGDDIPLLGGLTLQMSTVQLPVNVSVSEEKWRVTLNIAEQTRGEAAEIFKSEYSLQKKVDKLKKYMDKKELDVGKNPKIKGEIVGYAEGDMPLRGNNIKLQVYGQISVKFSKEVQVSAVVFAGEINGTVKTSGEIAWDMDELTLDGNMKLGGDIAVSAFAGLGVANLASAGVYGTGSFGIEWYLLPFSKTGLNEAYLEADLKAAIRVLGENAVEYQVLGPWRGYLYSRDLETYSLDSYQSLEEFLIELKDQKTTMLQARSTGKWDGSNHVLQQQAFTISEPVLMECDGDTVMLFVSNLAAGRAQEDTSVLAYSVYDPKTRTWGSPKIVADDGTADFNPSAAGGYVVWNNAKTTLTGEQTYEALGAKQEIAVAHYNSATDTFEQVTTLTDNNQYEANVKISDASGSPVVSWSQNQNGDIFGTSGTNEICMAELKNGMWETKKVTELSSIISELHPGILDGRPCAVYVTDENQNLADGKDQYAYLLYKDTGEKIRVSSKEARNVWLSQTGNKIFWIGTDGTVYERAGVSGTDTAVTEEDTVMGKVTQVAEDSKGNMTILYTVNGDQKSNAYRMSYDSATGKWSEPIAVTDQTDYVDSISGVYFGNEFIMAYNQRAIDEETKDLDGTNQICWTSVAAKKVVLSDIEADYHKWEVMPGGSLALSVRVKNSGMKPVSRLYAEIRSEAGNLLAQNVNISILPGETQDFDLTFTLPNDMVKREYTLVLTPLTQAVSEDTFSKTFTVGESYYGIERNSYQIGEKTMLVVSIRNIGFEPGNGTLEIYDNTGTDGVYESFDFQNLPYGKVLNYRTSVEGLNQNPFAVKALGMRVMKDGVEASESRNVTIFRGQDEEVSGIVLNKSRTHLKKVGDTEQLKATLLPKGLEGGTFTWSSSNPKAVTVDQSGNIRGAAEGSAVIRVTTADGAYYSQCLVTVVKEDIADEPGGDEPGGDGPGGDGPGGDGPGGDEPGGDEPVVPPDIKLPFVDVAKTDWYYSYVAYNYSAGTMTGVDGTHFAPADNLARAQFAVILHRLNDEPKMPYTNRFNDVGAGIWYTDAILWANSIGVVNGYSDTGLFGPGDYINREQMAVMMYRYANYLGYDTSRKADYGNFSDGSSVNGFAKEAMSWAVGMKIITGKDNGTRLDPQGNAARAECAAIIQRFIEKY